MSNLFALLLLACLILFLIGLFSPAASLFWDKKERSKKKSALVYGGLIILFFILFGVTSDSKAGMRSKEGAATPANQPSTNTEATSQPKDESTPAASGMPVEQKLAVLDASGYVDPSDPKVTRIKTLLDDLTSKYNQPADTIAEYTSKAQGVLHDSGIEESCADILEEMNAAGKIDNTPYRDAITVFLMLKVKAAGNK